MKAIIEELLNSSPHAQCIVFEDKIILRNHGFNKLAQLTEQEEELSLSSFLIYQSMDEWTIETSSCRKTLQIERAVLDQEYMLYTFKLKEKVSDDSNKMLEGSSLKMRWLTDLDGIVVEASSEGEKMLPVQDCIWEFVPKYLIRKGKKKQVVSFMHHQIQYEVRMIKYYSYFLFEVLEAEQRIEQFMAANELFDVLKLSEDCYIVHDTMSIYYANPATHHYLKMKNGSLIGKQLRGHLSESDLRLFKKSQLQQVQEKNRVFYETIKVINGDGCLVHTMCAVRPIEFHHKRLFISTLKQPFNQSKKRQEAMRVASRLSASMAHEIRNPLTTVKGFVQLFDETNALPPSQLTVIHSELERMEKIIGDYVFLAQEKDLEKKEAIYLKTYLEAFLEQGKIKKLTVNNPVLLSVSENFYIRGYRKELNVLFLNLLENAVDASTHLSPIQIRAYSENQRLCVQIIDKGTGISTDRMYLIGQPFFSSKEKGTGLGLMVCYKIAELHGGSVEIKTKTGVGTIVHVHFPLPYQSIQKKETTTLKEQLG